MPRNLMWRKFKFVGFCNFLFDSEKVARTIVAQQIRHAKYAKVFNPIPDNSGSFGLKFFI